MLRRVAALAASLGLALTLTTACSGDPDPVETTPGFATEEEAFAAAEATYRAYVDALNEDREVDPMGRASFDYLTGQALDAELATDRQLVIDGLRITGATSVTSFTGVASGQGGDVVTASVCLDVSDTRVLDADRVDVTPPERIDVVALSVEMAVIDGAFAVVQSTASTDQRC